MYILLTKIDNDFYVYNNKISFNEVFFSFSANLTFYSSITDAAYSLKKTDNFIGRIEPIYEVNKNLEKEDEKLILKNVTSHVFEFKLIEILDFNEYYLDLPMEYYINNYCPNHIVEYLKQEKIKKYLKQISNVYSTYLTHAIGIYKKHVDVEEVKHLILECVKGVNDCYIKFCSSFNITIDINYIDLKKDIGLDEVVAILDSNAIYKELLTNIVRDNIEQAAYLDLDKCVKLANFYPQYINSIANYIKTYYVLEWHLKFPESKIYLRKDIDHVSFFENKEVLSHLTENDIETILLTMDSSSVYRALKHLNIVSDYSKYLTREYDIENAILENNDMVNKFHSVLRIDRTFYPNEFYKKLQCNLLNIDAKTFNKLDYSSKI